MKKPQVDRNRKYGLGCVTQWCSSCSWVDHDLKCELSQCPECGSQLPGDCKITFGGTEIEFFARRGKFLIHPRGNEFARGIIYGADYTDVIVFLLKHGTIWLDND